MKNTDSIIFIDNSYSSTEFYKLDESKMTVDDATFLFA